MRAKVACRQRQMCIRDSLKPIKHVVQMLQEATISLKCDYFGCSFRLLTYCKGRIPNSS